MALFKILKGPEKKDSTGTSVMLNPTTSGLAIHEGWAYITDEGNFYVDISDSTRLKINQNADYAIIANKDSSNQTIVSTYIKGIDFVVDNSIQAGSKSNPYLRYTIGNGTIQKIALPAASSAQGGILTAAAQTIAGNKTFNNDVVVKGILTASKTNGLVYSGIQADTAGGASNYIWFSTTGGIPKYNTGFSFNPACTTAWAAYDSGATATAYTELKVGRVNGIALKALQDDSGQIIKNTYIKDIVLTTSSSAPYYTLTLGNGAKKDNDGTSGADKVIIPVASATQAGIITADKTNAQTITGAKIIDANGSLEIKKAEGFNYSGIQNGTATGARSVWFSHLNYSGTPCVNASFKFDPEETLDTTKKWSNEVSGTKSSVLHVPHIDGLAYKALRDSQGLVINNTYIKDITLVNNATAPYYTLTLGNGTLKTVNGNTQQVLLPVAGSSYGGIITNTTQSISGKKTFSDGIVVKLTATNTSATYYPWFSTVDSNGIGTPVYDTNFNYNASTNKLTATTFVGSLEGNAASATKVNNKLTVGSKDYDGSKAVTITASDLGLASAMLFLGTSATTITDGATTNPITVGGTNKTVTAGNVVLYGSKEFVWTGSAWEELGNEGSYKIVQAAVADPSASGTSNSFIATISQDTNGKITVSKKTVAVTNSAPTLSWGTTSTIGTVAGTNLQVKMPANPNTDTKVTQTVTTSNATYPLLLAPNGQTATTTTSAYFDSGVTLNPSTNTIAANISGNAATATKLATARTISLTGSVTGSGSFDGSGNLSIATTTNHTHSYLPLSGGTMTGTLQFSDNIGLKGLMAGGSDWWELKGTGADDAGVLELAVGDNATSDYFDIIFKDWSGTNTRAIRFGGAEIHAYVPLYGAVWNDYAEFRICNEEFKPGQVVLENGDDTLSIASQRLQRGCSIVSDTFGFAIGETDEAKCPIAVSGRVLAYGYESREEFKKHIGWPVCSGPNGTVSLMTEEEEEKYPSRIVGTVSAVPDYETWGTGNVKVDGRIWIKVR